MSDGFSEVEFGSGDEELRQNKNDKFTPESKTTYRISFCRFPIVRKNGKRYLDLRQKSPRFLKAPVSYVEGAGYVVHKNSTITKIVGKSPDERVGTIVVVWPVTSDGDLDEDLMRLGRWRVLPYVFSATKYQTYLRKNKARPFGKHDVLIACEDKQYQKLELTMLDDSQLYKMMADPERRDQFDLLLDEIEKVETRLKGFIGRVYTPEELRDKLGVDDDDDDTSYGYSSASDDVDVNTDDILDDL